VLHSPAVQHSCDSLINYQYSRIAPKIDILINFIIINLTVGMTVPASGKHSYDSVEHLYDSSFAHSAPTNILINCLLVNLTVEATCAAALAPPAAPQHLLGDSLD
jgi:hypothetical protein